MLEGACGPEVREGAGAGSSEQDTGREAHDAAEKGGHRLVGGNPGKEMSKRGRAAVVAAAACGVLVDQHGAELWAYISSFTPRTASCVTAKETGAQRGSPRGHLASKCEVGISIQRSPHCKVLPPFSWTLPNLLQWGQGRRTAWRPLWQGGGFSLWVSRSQA